MSFLFDEVFLYDFDEENLSFKKRFQKPFCIQVIDESDKLLIRSRVNQNNIYKDTPCSEFGNNGFVITDENARSIYLIFNKKFTYENEKANYSEIDLYRFTKLVNDFKLGRRESVFTLRTDEASASQYFQFYGYLSQQQNMMQDFVRTSTYQRAILSNGDDFKDKVILDVGAGSGILSFFAIQAGARKVFAVEASSMAKHAEQLVASNKLSDKILVIPGKIEEINLPEKVDIIISEPMGYMLFNERMLETYLHAKKWLKPSGKMFPTQADLHIAPFSDAQLYTEQLTKANFWFQQNFHGVDLTVLREAALKEYFYQPVVDTFDVRICIAKSNKHTIDFLKAHEKDLHVIDIPLKFHITQTDEIHGLAFWFDVGFFGSQQSVWLSTAPTQPLTHWYQVRCLLDKPLFVQRGHTVTGRVVLVSNRRQSYNN
ncbi:histone-arginine methyltransferase CARMER-like protein [Sarcoptes scabiei]|uniref:type I protein arginine methyltransferase n=1 Tax=Sarcoptes scabiei TaxID=52283 RepID=A0A131ZU52_SARSC|nr:histone-arginine methyltransferase CARMER-like protein [Sarcoptes scabiei]